METFWGSRDGAEVIVNIAHVQFWPGDIPYVLVEFVVGSNFVPRVFLQVHRFPIFAKINISKLHFRPG